MVCENILVSLCGRGDESIVINEAINIADGGQLSFVHVNDLHAGEMSMMMDAPLSDLFLVYSNISDLKGDEKDNGMIALKFTKLFAL